MAHAGVGRGLWAIVLNITVLSFYMMIVIRHVAYERKVSPRSLVGSGAVITSRRGIFIYICTYCTYVVLTGAVSVGVESSDVDSIGSCWNIIKPQA